MSNILMAGSLAAAFAAGMVAFFAPCCAGVMMPAYLAAIGSGHRFRIARLTAVYVLGVAAVVLPITLGAAALSSYVSRWHAQMFGHRRPELLYGRVRAESTASKGGPDVLSGVQNVCRGD